MGALQADQARIHCTALFSRAVVLGVGDLQRERSGTKEEELVTLGRLSLLFCLKIVFNVNKAFIILFWLC